MFMTCIIGAPQMSFIEEAPEEVKARYLLLLEESRVGMWDFRSFLVCVLILLTYNCGINFCCTAE